MSSSSPVVHISVPIRTIGKQVKKGRYGQIYISNKTKEEMQRIKDQAKFLNIEPYLKSHPVSIVIVANFVPVKSTSKIQHERMVRQFVKHTVKPDTDNITKLVKDSLTGVAYNDDKQVFKDTCIKQYSTHNSIDISITYHDVRL